jgi:hypothetical protein
LQSLDVHSNSLVGTIPSSVANWNGIQFVDVSNNLLTGTVPSGMCAVASLMALTADCANEITCECCTSCV